MKIAVFGAGAIGCWVGGRIASGGTEVTLVGRPRVIDELADGLTVSELGDRTWTVKPAVTADAATTRDADIVLVTVKSAATEQAAQELAHHTGTIVSLQNGVRNAQILRSGLPGRVVLAGMVGFNVARVGAGHYHRGTSGDIVVEANPALEPLVLACRAAKLPIKPHADIVAVQWGKLVMNLNNAINALSGKPLLDELSERGFRRCLAATQREALDILEAAHQPVAKVLALSARMVARILPMPDWAFRLVAFRFASVDPKARSSMQDDFIAGRRSEIDYLQGEIVTLAKRVARPAPINEKLVALVRAAEAGGKRDFTGGELLAALSGP